MPSVTNDTRAGGRLSCSHPTVTGSILQAPVIGTEVFWDHVIQHVRTSPGTAQRFPATRTNEELETVI